MSIERLEYHLPLRGKQYHLQRIGEIISSGGFSLLDRKEKRLELESGGYDVGNVQEALDWVEQRGLDGEKTAAILRGAFNDLIDQVNSQELSP